MRVTRLVFLAVTIVVAAALAPWGSIAADNDTTDRLATATDVLNEIMAAPDQGMPQDLLDKSACVVIIPEMKKAAFIIGAKYGRGFISCRRPSGKGWSAPAGVRVEGGSVGFRLVVQKPTC